MYANSAEIVHLMMIDGKRGCNGAKLLSHLSVLERANNVMSRLFIAGRLEAGLSSRQKYGWHTHNWNRSQGEAWLAEGLFSELHAMQTVLIHVMEINRRKAYIAVRACDHINTLHRDNISHEKLDKCGLKCKDSCGLQCKDYMRSEEHPFK